MSINIYTVANHLETEGWKLISTVYKNLNTELEMECPNGHVQKQTYAAWRKRPICEVCIAGDRYKIKKNKVPEKGTDTVRILALDAATNITGYAIYDDGDLVSYGTYKTDNTKGVTERINEMKYWLQNIIKEVEPDFIGVEDVQLQTFGQGQPQVKTYNTLSRLQGVILDTIFEACIDHDLAYAVEWRKYCGVGEGTGRENKKKQAQDKVKLWYDQDCTQDEADAICIGKYFVHKLKHNSHWGEDI